MARQVYFNEYTKAGSAGVVDVTAGLRSKKQAESHGKKVCKERGYAGFYISSKPEGAKTLPTKLVYYSRGIQTPGAKAAGSGWFKVAVPRKNPVRGSYQKSIQQDLLSGATVRPPAYTLKGKAKSYGKKYAQSFAAAIKDLEAQGVKVIRTPGVRGGEWGATYRKANGRGKGKGKGKKNPAGSTRVYKAKRVRITQYPDGSTRVHIER